jgi:hypothetical protein
MASPSRTTEIGYSTDPKKSAYQEIVPALVRSIKDAILEIWELRPDGLTDCDDKKLVQHVNRHFMWLAMLPTGRNRHFYDGSIYGPTAFGPLRTRAFSFKSEFPSDIRKRLEQRMAIDPALSIVIEDKDEPIVPDHLTRIASLIFDNVKDWERIETIERADDEAPTRRKEQEYLLKSPLSIALEFLTVPDTPGSYAYSLTTMRNYIFDMLRAYPQRNSSEKRTRANPSHQKYFRASDVERAYSVILTSTRPRFESKGRDPLPPRGRTVTGTVLREYFALKQYFWLRFKSHDSRVRYCMLDNISADYEFRRSPHLGRIPEIGEIINELWGVLLPIRGADTVFRGGLRFSSEGGLVIALHGGPGTGKTTLSLAFGAYLAAFRIDTLFITAEEHEGDLRARASSISPESYRRLSFFPRNSDKWLSIQRVTANSLTSGSKLREMLKKFASLRASGEINDDSGAGRICNRVIVLDGIHDLLSDSKGAIDELRDFIAECRQLHSLVILTTGEEWASDNRIDYLVDMAIRLSNASTEEYSRKPDRRFLITKARFQLCATGTHGLQIAGEKGVRLSPQINYQLDRRAIWKPRLPEFDAVKVVTRIEAASPKGERILTADSVNISRGSNIFINGLGSGGKAALALKIAMAPSFLAESVKIGPKDFDRHAFAHPSNLIPERENILIISFLYAREYYTNIFNRLRALRKLEMPKSDDELLGPFFDIIHLYPGYLRPNDLFNRIEWRLQEAELEGMPFTSVIIEGIHNVFLQFPELQRYPLFWPQLFSMLRSRPLTTITTHTNIDLSYNEQARALLREELNDEDDVEAARAVFNIDDKRSEPLRHALVQQTDFSFDVTPTGSDRNHFDVRVTSAINQSIPLQTMMWSRDGLIFLAKNLWSSAERKRKGSRRTSRSA